MAFPINILQKLTTLTHWSTNTYESILLSNPDTTVKKLKKGNGIPLNYIHTCGVKIEIPFNIAEEMLRNNDPSYIYDNYLTTMITNLAGETMQIIKKETTLPFAIKFIELPDREPLFSSIGRSDKGCSLRLTYGTLLTADKSFLWLDTGFLLEQNKEN